MIGFDLDLCPAGNAAEVGVATGRVALELLQDGRFPTVYLVDRWRQVAEQSGDASEGQPWHDRNYAEALAKVAPYGGQAVVLRGDSVEMAGHVPDNTLGFLFVDADHSFEGVTADIKAWWPKLVSGGVALFDDYATSEYGVSRAVEAAGFTATLADLEGQRAWVVKP